MSTRLPPQVELMRLETLNTLSGSSSNRPPPSMPHTCIFLPKATRSGCTPKCFVRPEPAGQADAGLHLVEDQQRVVLVRDCRSAARNSVRK